MNNRIPSPSGRRPLRASFTLIEMLVVIAIIVILAGLITAATMHFYAKALVSRTQATLTILGAALEEFKNTYGSYPYADPKDDPTNSLHSPAPATALDKWSGPITTTDDDKTFDNRNIYYLLRDRSCLKEPIDGKYLKRFSFGGSATPANNDSDNIILDAWENPIVYRFDPTLDNGQFRLWSMGPDGADSRATPGANIDPSDTSNSKNEDNVVWGKFQR